MKEINEFPTGGEEKLDCPIWTWLARFTILEIKKWPFKRRKKEEKSLTLNGRNSLKTFKTDTTYPEEAK